MELFGQPDVRVESEWCGHFVGEESANRAAVDPPDDLADEPAVGDGVVAVRRARLPARRLGGQAGAHRLEVVALVDRRRVVERRKAGLVTQQLPSRHRLLAGGAELGPDVGDRCVEVELAALPQEQGAHRRPSLGGGEDEGERVLRPGLPGCSIGHARPQVDDRSTVHVDSHRGSHLAQLLEVADEGLAHRFEAGLDGAVYVHRAAS